MPGPIKLLVFTTLVIFVVLSLSGEVRANFQPTFVPNDDIFILTFMEGPSTPVGTFLHIFEGSDADGDQLIFILNGDQTANKFFKLESTGRTKSRLVLKEELDRERTPEFLIDFAVTDGRTTKPTNQSCLIIVEDVNDNDPVFEGAKLSVKVTENGEAPLVLWPLIWATDLDEGPNGEIRYSLDTEDKHLFQLSIDEDEEAAVITLLQPLDYETKKRHELRLVASDSPLNLSDIRTAKITLMVEVEDENDNGPLFVSLPREVTPIREDAPVGTRICDVKAIDGDVTINSPIQYELLNENDKFVVDLRSGTVKTKVRLDQVQDESIYGLISLRVRASEVTFNQESGMREALKFTDATVILSVVDMDDKPHFRNRSYQGFVPENSPVGYPVILKPGYIPEVHDKDQGAKAFIRLSIDGSGGTFQVFPTQGYMKMVFQLIVKDGRRLDYENIKEIKFSLVAEGHTGNRSAVPVSIFITDMNDNPPVFEKESYAINIPESLPTGKEILTVKVTDQDSGDYGSNGIRYSILPGLISNAYGQHNENILAIGKISGRISIGNVNMTRTMFDRELHAELYFMVEAADNHGLEGSNKATALVTIQLEDVNDNSPEFLQSSYEAHVLENTSDISLPLRIQAVDDDQRDTPNSQITYSISNNSYLEIDPVNGYIWVKKAFDMEMLSSVNYQVNFTVTASDHGTPPLQSHVILNLIIVDMNDCAPVFSTQNVSVLVREDVESGALVTKITAIDGDVTPAFSKVSYMLLQPSGKFSISRETGEVRFDPGLPESRLTYRKQNKYIMNIVAIDDMGLRSEPPCSITIAVADVNNEMPRFIFPEDRICQTSNISSARIFHGSILEHSQSGTAITRIEAIDDDTSADLQFRIDYADLRWFKNGTILNKHFPSMCEKVVSLENVYNGTRAGVIVIVGEAGNLLDYHNVDKLMVSLIVEDIASETGPQADQAWVILDVQMRLNLTSSESAASPIVKDGKLPAPLMSVITPGDIPGLTVLNLQAKSTEENKITYSLLQPVQLHLRRGKSIPPIFEEVPFKMNPGPDVILLNFSPTDVLIGSVFDLNLTSTDLSSGNSLSKKLLQPVRIFIVSKHHLVNISSQLPPQTLIDQQEKIQSDLETLLGLAVHIRVSISQTRKSDSFLQLVFMCPVTHILLTPMQVLLLFEHASIMPQRLQEFFENYQINPASIYEENCFNENYEERVARFILKSGNMAMAYAILGVIAAGTSILLIVLLVVLITFKSPCRKNNYEHVPECSELDVIACSTEEVSVEITTREVVLLLDDADSGPYESEC